MAKMTMTYKAKINNQSNNNSIQSMIINGIKSYGPKGDISPMFEGNTTLYIAHSPITAINILENGQVEISDVDCKKRNIEKTKSKLLKMVGGLTLK